MMLDTKNRITRFQTITFRRAILHHGIGRFIGVPDNLRRCGGDGSGKRPGSNDRRLIIAYSQQAVPDQDIPGQAIDDNIFQL